MKFTSQIIASLAVLSNWANAAIAENGLWTGNDWYDSATKIGVANGMPYSNDADVTRHITAPLSREYDPTQTTYLSFENVERIQRVFPESQWPIAFPYANAIYTYENFLKAAAKFPAFCNESNTGMDLDSACKRELAGIFAHWGQETGARMWSEEGYEHWQQALYWVEEIRCSGTFLSSCNYKSTNWSAEQDAWPPQDGVQYYGRGPFQLSWNYNYGQFSNVFAPQTYDSKMYLLRNPNLLHQDGSLAMASGIWFYMTPQDPKPSMHDVMTGFFEPNAVDQAANIGATFGTTTNIINGALECNSWSDKMRSRGEYFLEWLNFFGLPSEDGLYCGDQAHFSGHFGGASDVSGYWDAGDTNTCTPVNYMTQYSIVAPDDYKRCVCDKHGQGEADCPQAEGTPDDGNNDDSNNDGSNDGSNDNTDDNNTDDNNTDDNTPAPQPDPVWLTQQTLQQIAQNPNFGSDRPSMTLYQVDRDIKLMQAKFEMLYDAAQAKGLI